VVIQLQADLTVESAVASVQITANFFWVSERIASVHVGSGVVAFEADGAARFLYISPDQIWMYVTRIAHVRVTVT
jgi:hypothetical protein